MKKLLIGLVVLVAAAAVALPTLAATNAQTVRVTEREYSISLSMRPKAGTVVFVVRNAGDDTHDFWLRGGGKTLRSRTLGEGGSSRLVAKLRKGVRYTYWCGVSDHAAEGMRGSFRAR